MRYDPPIHRTQGLLALIVGAVILLIYPLVFEATYYRHVIILAFIFALLATNWDLSLGYAGLFNFAHIALFAVGMYTYAILAKTIGISPWLALLAGGFMATLVALLISLPVLRLDGIYVILVTLALSQLIYFIVISWSSVTGGTSGMVTLPTMTIGGYRLSSDGRIGYYYLGLGLLMTNLAFLYWVSRSRLGRAMMALRDNKYYAIARGVSEARTRAMTLAASAMFTGIAGAFYSAYLRVASPDAFGVGFLTLVLSILLVGGTGTIWGPLIGAFFITILSEWLVGFGPWQNIIISVAIILVVVFYPGGLWAALQELREVFEGFRSRMTARSRRRREAAFRTQLTGAPERFVQTSHGLISVADTATDKPALLFLHGNSACKEAFFKQFKSLADTYRVLAFDLPGHGVSENADPETSYNLKAYATIAEEVLADAGIKSVHVVGWSLGGYVALELAARGNVTVASLALCGTSPLAAVPDDMGRGYVASSHMVLTGKQFLSRDEARSYAQHATAPLSSDSAFMHRAVRRTDGRARFYLINNLGVIDWPRQMRVLTEGQIPVAILNGSDDPFINHDYVKGLRYGKLWKGAPQDVQNGKHAPFFNESDAFDLSLFAFLSFADTESALDASAAREVGA